ncbi:hypothetical protein XENTR_v10023026 [Xenopus tropicalis]|nr:hypothetical protein XENTR_v10023026 [Xenopus tropicalis]
MLGYVVQHTWVGSGCWGPCLGLMIETQRFLLGAPHESVGGNIVPPGHRYSHLWVLGSILGGACRTCQAPPLWAFSWFSGQLRTLGNIMALSVQMGQGVSTECADGGREVSTENWGEVSTEYWGER